MPVTNVNSSNNVQPNIQIKIERLVASQVDEVTFATSDSQGNFSHDTTIDQSLEGQTIEYRFTNLETNEVVTVPYNLPLLSTIPLDLILPTEIYTGDGSYGSVSVFPGVAVTGQLDDPTVSLYADLSSLGISDISRNLGLAFPLGTDEGTYTGTVSATGYPSPDNESTNVIYGIAAEVVLPGDPNFVLGSHTIKIQAKPGNQITINYEGNDYNATVPGSGELFYDVPVASIAREQVTATITTPTVPTPQVVQLNNYALTTNFPSIILTNLQQNENADITGNGVPGYTVTVDIPELSLNLTGDVDETGTYEIAIPVTPWQQRGTYNAATFTAIDSIINNSGTHLPDIEFVTIPQNVVQGSSVQQFQIRADANTQLFYEVLNYVPLQAFTTDASGYATLNYPSIPLLTQVPTSANIQINYDLGISVIQEIEINPRIPLTINIATEPIPDFDNILFTNKTYTITGDAPGDSLATSLLSLSPIGNLASFTFDSHTLDQYQATITTGSEPSNLKIIAAIPLQPSETANYQIAYPLALVVPTGTINHDDSSFNVITTTTANKAVTLTWQYLNDNDGIVIFDIETIVADNNGDAIFSFSPQNISGASQIKFIAQVSTAYKLEEVRNYENNITQNIANDSGIVAIYPTTMFSGGVHSNAILPDIESFAVATGSGMSDSASNFNAVPLLEANNQIFFNNKSRFTSYYLAYFQGSDFNYFFNTYPNFSLVFDFIPRVSSSPVFRLQFGLELQLDIYANVTNKYFTITHLPTAETTTVNYSFNQDSITRMVAVFLKNNPLNINNSTIKLYIDGVLEANYNFASVITLTSSSIRTIDFINNNNSGSFGIVNSTLLYDKELTQVDVDGLYNSGVRKKIRKATMLDYAKSFNLSIVPSDSELTGYYEQATNLFGSLPVVASRTGANYLVDNTFTINQDSANRNYISLNNSRIRCGNNSLFNGDIAFVVKRSSLNSQKQVIFDSRIDAGTFDNLQIAFTATDTLTIWGKTGSTTFYQLNYQSSAFQTNDLLCLYIELGNTEADSNCYVNGVEPTKTFQSITDPGFLQDIGDNRHLTIGASHENLATNDYFSGDFYGFILLNNVNSQDNTMLNRFGGDKAKLVAYYFYCMGFPEVMQSVDSAFPLLSNFEGFYYV